MSNKKMFAKNLRYLRTKKGLEQQDISNMLGLKSPTSVTNWERGNNLARSGHLSDLANFFGVTMHDLVNTDIENMQQSSFVKLETVYNQLEEYRQDKVYNYAEEQLEEQKELQTVKVYGQTAAGAPLAYGDDFVEEREASYVPKGAEVALVVSGDSMLPEFDNGDIVFYKRQPTLENGELGIFEIDGGVTFKKFKIDHETQKIHLVSLNEKYEDLILKEVKILGKVVM